MAENQTDLQDLSKQCQWARFAILDCPDISRHQHADRLADHLRLCKECTEFARSEAKLRKWFSTDAGRRTADSQQADQSLTNHPVVHRNLDQRVRGRIRRRAAARRMIATAAMLIVLAILWSFSDEVRFSLRERPLAHTESERGEEEPLVDEQINALVDVMMRNSPYIDQQDFISERLAAFGEVLPDEM